MGKIVIASKNRGKIKELQAMFAGTETQILSLNDFPDGYILSFDQVPYQKPF